MSRLRAENSICYIEVAAVAEKSPILSMAIGVDRAPRVRCDLPEVVVEQPVQSLIDLVLKPPERIDGFINGRGDKSFGAAPPQAEFALFLSTRTRSQSLDSAPWATINCTATALSLPRSPPMSMLLSARVSSTWLLIS